MTKDYFNQELLTPICEIIIFKLDFSLNRHYLIKSTGAVKVGWSFLQNFCHRTTFKFVRGTHISKKIEIGLAVPEVGHFLFLVLKWGKNWGD